MATSINSTTISALRSVQQDGSLAARATYKATLKRGEAHAAVINQANKINRSTAVYQKREGLSQYRSTRNLSRAEFYLDKETYYNSKQKSARNFIANHKYGYEVFFVYAHSYIILPITPGEIKMSMESNNDTINLIDEGDVNILKSPGLKEITFEARFPMCKYPYSRNASVFQDYYDFFMLLKNEKVPFQLKILRPYWDTDIKVSLEDISLLENQEDNGDDVIIEFNLKEAKDYGVKKYVEEKPQTTSTSIPESPRQEEAKPSATETIHTVTGTDTLWGIATKYYGNGQKYTVIYEANKDTIEAEAKNHGRASSSNGHWIYAGTKLTIPNS